LGFLIFNFYPPKIFPGYGVPQFTWFWLSPQFFLGKTGNSNFWSGSADDGRFIPSPEEFCREISVLHDKKHLHHLLLGWALGKGGLRCFMGLFLLISGISQSYPVRESRLRL